MRAAHIDWGSDQTTYLLILFGILMLLAILMERASPKKKKRQGRRGKGADVKVDQRRDVIN